jgi:hypothetical protein
MRTIASVIALVFMLVAPAFAQKAEIEAVNTKWIEFFDKGDFAGGWPDNKPERAYFPSFQMSAASFQSPPPKIEMCIAPRSAWRRAAARHPHRPGLTLQPERCRVGLQGGAR